MTTERTALWTLSMLTIPSRLPYLGRLLRSIAELELPRPFDVTVVYNRETEQEPLAIEAEIQAMAPTLPVRVYVNANDTSIVGGRAVQLGVCRTPMLAFIDDDLTLHGDVFGTIERTLRARPMGVVGLPSFEGDTGQPVKPRDSTPSVRLDGVRYMPVQGMLVAGYRRLFADVGGFNPRRRFWGEWTEFNVRLWRHGFPTGYPLESTAHLRHWSAAPESPTRNMGGRERHVLWGLLCTAMEYDAVSINEATEAFWRLAEDRYLAYSFGAVPSAKELLATVLELMPQLAEEFPAIRAFAEETRRHRFQFKPFQDLSESDVREVLAFAEGVIGPYRPEGLLAGA